MTTPSTETATTPSVSTARRLALHAIPFAACVVVAGATVLYADRLPEQIASHWSGDTADGWMSPSTLTALSGGLIILLGFGGLKMAALVPGGMARGVAGVAGGLAAFLATLHVVTLVASLDAPTRPDVAFPGGGLALALLLAVGVGLVTAAIARSGPEATTQQMTPERLEVLPGEAVVWNGSATVPMKLMVLPALIAVMGVVVLVIDEPWAGVTLLLSAALATSVVRVRVTVGPAGMTVRSGPLGLLRARVPLAAVTAVHAEHVEPMTYGGWGLRVVPGARAVIVRCGEGLRIERRDKADLVVTVDDARRGAGVLLAHLAAAQA